MKIAVALSGGVDSSVAAKILKDEGHELVGLFLKLWNDPRCPVEQENRCCNYEALEDARMLAKSLAVPFYVINAEKKFKEGIVDYFLDEYKNLRTPNPCILCNEKIKFDLLLKKTLEIGCSKLATGHYAQIKEIDGKYHLYKGIDENKDQSYMLYRLNQNQLSKALFPLGEMKKFKVRKLAVKWNLPVKEKPESQEICFFADKDYRAFLKRYLDKKYFAPGAIVAQKGTIIGKHEGLLNYTIGQRKGIDQLSTKKKKPLYVVGFDVKKNQLIVGEDKEVYKKEMIVDKLNWITGLNAESLRVKIRYRHPEVPCKIKKASDKKIKVIFEKLQRAITPGQSAVFYDGGEVIGGGIIAE